MALQFSSPSLSSLVRKKRTGKGKALPDDDTILKDKACRLKIDVDDIILQMSKGDPTKLRLTNFIKGQLTAIDRTPDHPVYAIMIQEAITNLNEDGGSTREAISEFILGKYDVINVVHPAKLIDQLRKLVSRHEIILTSENRYKVPVEDCTGDANLKLVEQGLSIREQDEQGCKPCNSEEVVYLLGGPNELNENQCQTTDGEMKNGIMGSQLEEQDVRVCKPCTVEGHLREDQNTISEERHRLQCQTEPLYESPFSQVAGFISQDNLQEEQTSELIEMFWDDERSTKIIERCEDDELSGPPGYHFEDSKSEMLTLEGRIVTMTGAQIIEVNEGNVEVIDEVALCGQNVNQVNDERDAEQVQHSREETQTTELSQAKGQAPKEVEDKVQNVGSFLALLPSKDKLAEWRKGMVTMERELREIIDHLSSVDVPDHVTSLNQPEVFMLRESDPKAVSLSVDTFKDSVQNMWNCDDLTRQKEQAKTCIGEEVLKSQLKLMVTSAASLFMNLEQLTMTKQQYLSSSECSLGVCGTQKLSECEVVASSSPPGPIECQKLDLEQQLEPGMMGRPEKMQLSQSQIQDLDSNSQRKHAKCNRAAMTSDAVQILQNSPNVNPEEVENLAGTRKRKWKWKNQLPTRKGLRLRNYGGSQPDETKAETLQPKHVGGRKDRPQPDASELQIKRRGRPPKHETSTKIARRKRSHE